MAISGRGTPAYFIVSGLEVVKHGVTHFQNLNNMKTWFTADWHLGEDRLGINGKPDFFDRPVCSTEQQDRLIIQNFMSVFRNGDELYHLGDVVYNMNKSSIETLRQLKSMYPNSKFTLISGNYDDGRTGDLGLSLFDFIYPDKVIDLPGIGVTYLNHYPNQCLEQVYNADLCLTAHIHGLWRVQKGMVNVGVDVWNYKPVGSDRLVFYANAIKNVYDENVFPY